jgi:hypothetical protein
MFQDLIINIIQKFIYEIYGQTLIVNNEKIISLPSRDEIKQNLFFSKVATCLNQRAKNKKKEEKWQPYLDERQKPNYNFFLIRIGKQLQQKRHSNEVSSGVQLSTLSVILEIENGINQNNQ